MTTYELGTLLVQAVGWGLLHFVWQAAIVGVVYAAARSMLPRGNARYLAAMLALVALAVLPAWTIVHAVGALSHSVDLGGMVVAGSPDPARTGVVAAGPVGGLALLATALPWLVLAWACGVVFLGLRVARQWRSLRDLVRAATASPVWQDRAERLGARLGLQRAVRILVSVMLATPTLVGWIRPVVVMPVAMLARMPAEQVDFILAHELAHLRRFDHIANLFQVVLETLLFYHPVVHWISRDARNERELCCDALALQSSGGSRRDFVAALAGLEEFRCEHAELALAASGGVLADRAWFIAGVVPARQPAHHGLTTALLALLGVAVVAGGVAWRQNAAQARIEGVIAANAVALQHGFAAAGLSMAVPVLRTVAVPLPALAPALIRAEAPTKPPALDQVPATGIQAVPSLRVPDVAPSTAAPTVSAPNESATAPVPAVPADVAVAPRALHTVRPTYPTQARENGAQGEVDIAFTLDAAGVPRDLRVVQSPHSGQLDAAALRALSRWRFAPPTEPGLQYHQAFTFRLDGAAGGDDTAAGGCLVRTGTHICRPVFDAGVGARVLQPHR